jgi:uncharacterized iron-regulated protein
MRPAAPLSLAARSALSALFALSLAACGPAAGKPPANPNKEVAAMPARPTPFVTTLEASHPLVGKAWDVAGKKLVDDAALLAAARGAHFVFLGEKHDNPDHHRLQAWVIDAIVKGGRKPAIAMEQFDVESQPAIDAVRKAQPKDADAIATATRWSETGWPPWEQYAPIVRLTVEADLPLVAANLSRARGKALVRGGIDAMAPEERARLLLDRPLDPKMAASQRAELDDVHCGMEMPPKILDGMAFAERARDAVLADRMISGDRDGGVVLVAGTGHTRTDRGVPEALAARGRKDAHVSIAFVEVAPGVNDAPAYAEGWHAEALPFDFVLFTPRANDDDPCAGMRAPKGAPIEQRAPAGGGGGSM